MTSKMVFVHLHRKITSGWSAGRLSEIWLHLLVRGVVQNVGQAVVVAFEATSPSLWRLIASSGDGLEFISFDRPFGDFSYGFIMPQPVADISRCFRTSN